MYLKITNGSPAEYSLAQLRADNPGTSFPAQPSAALLASYDVYPYTVDDVPAYSSTVETVGPGAFYQQGVQWRRGWVVSAIPIEQRRAEMRAYRLAFEDACAQTAYGQGTLLGAIDTLLASLGSAQARRYNNITIFERTKSEVNDFLIVALGMTEEQVDNLFLLAMQIEGTA